MINVLFICLLIYMIVIIHEYKRLETIKDCFILITSIFMVIILLINLLPLTIFSKWLGWLL